MKKFKHLTLSAAVLAFSLGFASGAMAQNEAAKQELKNADGEIVGSVLLKETPKGVLITIDAMGLTEGATHAVHIHETGKCSPDFKAAGGHFNPGEHNHGMMHEDGQHAGDMPNLHANSEGKVKQEILNTMLTTNDSDTDDGRHTIHDADGSALIIHDGADDYVSQPTGDAGDRYACAVLSAPKE